MLATVVLTGAAAALTALPASASCAFAADDPQLVARADVIFSGILLADEPAQLGAQRRLTFRVEQVYKGSAFAEQQVLTDARSSEALRLTPPGPFTVFAQGAGAATAPVAQLTADPCGGTRAGTAPTTLGAGRPPTEGSSRGQGSGGRSVAFIAGGVLIIAGAVYYGRRGRRSGPPR